jgi:prepilin-type N-terminal cleavage/methylation domain-containing protein
MRNKKGFTLIELLIVVVIVGILALAAIPLITANTRDARRSEGEQMLGSVKNQGKVAYAKHGTATILTLVGDITDNTGWGCTATQLVGKYYTVVDPATGTMPTAVVVTATANNGTDGTATGTFNFDAPGADTISFP